jgi:hypothetical protein
MILRGRGLGNELDKDRWLVHAAPFPVCYSLVLVIRELDGIVVLGEA